VRGYFLDYFVQENGVKTRKRVRIGQVPLAQAKKVLAQSMVALVEGKFLGGDKPKATFFQAAESFLAYSQARKRTHYSDTLTVGRLKEFFGDRSLESLTPDLVEAYFVHRRKTTKGRKGVLSGTTLNRDVACLKTIIRRALLNRQIDRNPIEGVRRFKEQSRNRTLEPEEYQRLLAVCPSHLRPIMQVGYLTGMRAGEILGLRWKQVDFKNRVITLGAEDTKTQERREVPLNAELIQILMKVERVVGCPQVFTFRGKPIARTKFSFTHAVRKAGIEDFRFHDLRHCAITNLRKAGVSDNVIMSISGHKTNAMFKRYDRVDRGDREAALQKAQALIDTNMTRAQGEAKLSLGA
jgi:integrase